MPGKHWTTDDVPYKKGAKIGKYRIEMGRVSIVTLTQRDSIVAQAVSHKNEIEVPGADPHQFLPF